MHITAVTAYPLSAPIPPAYQVSLGIGKTLKRDAVLVRVDTDSDVSGWGEAHAARAPTVIAELINSTLGPLVRGMAVEDTAGVWTRVYRNQLASHGTGAAAAIALSGIDLALWDAHGRAQGLPLHTLLGAPARTIPAYAGGISLGFQPVESLLKEALQLVALGYRALKLRLGASVDEDALRVREVRAALGSDIDLLVDANCAYTIDDVRALMPVLDAARVGWLEEPFPAHDVRAYRALRGLGATPIAAGENHYTRFDFERLAEEGVVRIWQPDLSKTGGLTEALQIAALAREAGARIHPHTSVTGLNVAASLHFLCALPDAGYFEADCAQWNPLRTRLTHPCLELTAHGFRPPSAPGLGTEVDVEALTDYPVITGAGYLKS